MKTIYADLLDDVVSSYDQTKTTLQGRAISKTIDGDVALGPPLNKFLDVFTDAAITPAGNAMVCTPNGRIFVVTAEATAIATLGLYTINFATGATSYVGKLNISLPDTAATTSTYRSIKVIDTGTTGWKIFLSTTGSVLINGGTFLINKIDLADFVPIGFGTIPFATAGDAKAVYFLQDPAAIGVGQLQTVTNGTVLDIANNRLYAHNGLAATHQYYVYDTSATPTYTTGSVTGVAATDIITHTGHTFLDNDPIVFTAISGGAGITVGTVYFVRNQAANQYQISATSGGAVLNFTTDIASGTVGRAFGTTGSNFVHKTGNLPTVTGAILTTDSEDFAQPTGTGVVAIDGFDCVFFSTASNLYLGRLSELTSGTTTWPSLSAVNLLGAPNEIIAPTASFATWSNVLNKALYITLTNIVVMKPFANNSIDSLFGGNNNKYFEGQPSDVVELQINTAGALDVEAGYLFALGTATGQRGVFVSDLRSDAQFDYSYIVTKVLDAPQAIYKFITTLDKLFDFTGSLDVYYRNSGFGSVSGGWIHAPFASDLSSLAAASNQIQFKILFSTLGLDTSIPAQLCEFALSFSSLNEISNNFEYTHDDSDPGNPSRVAFRLKKAYASSVPTLYFRAYDLSETLVASHNTSANPTFFQYSTDSGANWTSLGTIPNTVGTLVRYTFSTPPGVDVRPSIRES